MNFILLLITFVIGWVSKDPMYFIAASIFGIGFSIEYLASKIKKIAKKCIREKNNPFYEGK